MEAFQRWGVFTYILKKSINQELHIELHDARNHQVGVLYIYILTINVNTFLLLLFRDTLDSEIQPNPT